MSNVSQAVFNEFIKAYNSHNQLRNDELIKLKKEIDHLKNRQKHIEDNFAGLYDVFYAHDKLSRMKSISVSGFYDFLERMKIDKNSNISIQLMVESLISYVNAVNSDDPVLTAKFMVEAFRIRNQLVELAVGETPEIGSLAVISMSITNYASAQIKNLDWIVYQIGTNSLGIDSLLMTSKAGDVIEHDIKDESTREMNKCVITVHSLNKRVKSDMQNISRDIQKKKEWNEKFQSHEIK